MPVIFEAILASAGMLIIFGVAFFFIFLLALVMSPLERSLSKMIWDSSETRKPLPAPPKGSYKDFSKKH
ncbi:MAG: hypothetical protein H7Y05_00455 [Steroidobacteraceae bacterium]|nr:hypothetical protein [Deltaproteobacteria bacterium]